MPGVHCKTNVYTHAPVSTAASSPAVEKWSLLYDALVQREGVEHFWIVPTRYKGWEPLEEGTWKKKKCRQVLVLLWTNFPMSQEEQIWSLFFMTAARRCSRTSLMVAWGICAWYRQTHLCLISLERRKGCEASPRFSLTASLTLLQTRPNRTKSSLNKDRMNKRMLGICSKKTGHNSELTAKRLIFYFIQ